jgi:hypothetical protein
MRTVSSSSSVSISGCYSRRLLLSLLSMLTAAVFEVVFAAPKATLLTK